ncbi:putative late blight resistance protein homolog R1B-16 [Capsicum annuum]|uniref:putative late blight resistance protein homolog R1B-16 n=1 Tax=Capsicum annuum TaxID=4072 RepID=UPI001FB0C1FE|nr:putative late blight resistance protein homolog R1B-16 [Capsicum annuum]XP_047264804.1 putative late blight resistance protein homolog R1B-16 [Capsicum annuum]
MVNVLTGKSTPARATASTYGSFLSVDEEIVGFQDDVESIIQQLTKGTKELDVVSIVGMPGLGKTTLATMVFNHHVIDKYFDVRASCSISKEYNLRKVCSEILKQVLGNVDGILDEDMPDKLRKSLMRKRYLIVLDDIWEVKAWEEFRLCFQDDENGSRIMLTTRDEEVARQIKHHSDPYFLRFLTMDESWKLLQKKVFQGEICPSELRGAGLRVAKSCKGLPLVIVLIAGIIAKQVRASSWLEIAKDLSSHVLEEQSTKIIESSYNYLEDHLKSCLLYMGLFPEDYKFPVSNLLKLWIAEDFVHDIMVLDNMDMEEASKTCLNDLVNRSLVIVSERREDNGEIEYCTVHDVVREFCLRKLPKEKFMQYHHAKKHRLSDDDFNEEFLYRYEDALKKLTLEDVDDNLDEQFLQQDEDLLDKSMLKYAHDDLDDDLAEQFLRQDEDLLDKSMLEHVHDDLDEDLAEQFSHQDEDLLDKSMLKYVHDDLDEDLDEQFSHQDEDLLDMPMLKYVHDDLDEDLDEQFSQDDEYLWDNPKYVHVNLDEQFLPYEDLSDKRKYVHDDLGKRLLRYQQQGESVEQDELIDDPEFSPGDEISLFHVLDNLKFIRVLHLLDVDLKRHSWATVVQVVTHLRYLAICTQEFDFKWVSHLHDLQTLQVVRKDDLLGHLQTSPSFWKMQKLRHVDIQDFSFKWEDNDRAIFEESSETVLPNLKTFGKCRIYLADKTPEFWWRFPNIEQLKLHFIEPGYEVNMPNLEELPVQSLELCFSRPISGYKSTGRANCVVFPSNLNDLSLDRLCLTEKAVSQLAKLQNLESLKLRDVYFKSEDILQPGYSTCWDVSDYEFQALKYLNLQNVLVTEWRSSEASFPVLEQLILNNCVIQCGQIPCNFVDIPTLKLIKLIHCDRSLGFSALNIKKEVEEISGCDSLQVLSQYKRYYGLPDVDFATDCFGAWDRGDIHRMAG